MQLADLFVVSQGYENIAFADLLIGYRFIGSDLRTWFSALVGDGDDHRARFASKVAAAQRLADELGGAPYGDLIDLHIDAILPKNHV